MENVETLNEAGVTKIVATCPHCFNTLANEYSQLGGHYQVIHHTQLLGELVETGRLVPVTAVDEKVTYGAAETHADEEGREGDVPPEQSAGDGQPEVNPASLGRHEFDPDAHPGHGI